MDISNFYIMASGLGGLKDSIITNWIGPAFLILIAVYALKLLKERQFMQALIFVAMAALVAVLIYGGDTFFGKNGTLTKSGTDIGKQVNTISAWVFSGFKH